jgi:hypothetical protein
MVAGVIGLRRMPSGVAVTEARVPSLMSNCRLNRAGSTIWPLVEKQTLSTFPVCMANVCHQKKSKSIDTM